LTKEELKVRTIRDMDIVNDNFDKHFEYKESEDPSKVKIINAKLGPLEKDWKEKEAKIMVYKMVKVDVGIIE
jgi:hypothetical protein